MHGPYPQTPIFLTERAGRKCRQHLDFEGDACEKRNHAWLWAHQFCPQNLYSLECNLDLRAWGYVFWDSNRLEKLGVMKEPRSVLDCSRFPEHYDDPLGDRLYTEPSAQERLRGMGLA